MHTGTPAVLDRLERGAIAGVGDVDEHPQRVHPVHGPAPEVGQPAIGRLAAARAERVALAVHDAQHPDAEPVEDVDAVELVLDRRAASIAATMAIRPEAWAARMSATRSARTTKSWWAQSL